MPARVKHGGRQKGTPNKTTAEIGELAREHGEKAIQTLVALLDSPRPEMRERAAVHLLDRGYGKPTQQQILSGDANNPIEFRISFRSGV